MKSRESRPGGRCLLSATGEPLGNGEGLRVVSLRSVRSGEPRVSLFGGRSPIPPFRFGGYSDGQ